MGLIGRATPRCNTTSNTKNAVVHSALGAVYEDDQTARRSISFRYIKTLKQSQKHFLAIKFTSDKQFVL